MRVITNPHEPVLSAPRGALRPVPPLPEADDFDRLLDHEAQRVSAMHWTPAIVCRRVSQLLALRPGERVLDVGCGVGKLCVLGSLHSEGLYVGVEVREQLVLQARQVAAGCGSRAQFIHSDAFEVDWAGFQALYFYNPFDEARFPASWRIDGSIQTGSGIFDAQVHRTQQRLADLAAGTRVVTFHGIGGLMPECYRLQATEVLAGGVLELWSRS